MDTPKTELTRRGGLGKLAVGALVAFGVALSAASPAMADNWKHNNNGHGQWDNGHGNKHWKKQQHQNYYYQPTYYYQQRRPKVIYVQPQPVYVAPPPVYYYQPAPVYHRPQINIVFPFDFD
jgi:hypothetical protein